MLPNAPRRGVSLRNAAVMLFTLAVGGILILSVSIGERPESTENKRVLLVSGIDLDVSFYAPIMGYIWNDHLGIRSMLVSCGDRELWQSEPMFRVIGKWLDTVAQKTESLRLHVTSPKGTAQLTASMMRVYGAAWDQLHEQETLIVTQPNHAVIQRTLLNMHRRRVLITDASCCSVTMLYNVSFRKYATDAIAMSAADWRSLLQLKSNRNENDFFELLDENYKIYNSLWQKRHVDVADWFSLLFHQFLHDGDLSSPLDVRFEHNTRNIRQPAIGEMKHEPSFAEVHSWRDVNLPPVTLTDWEKIRSVIVHLVSKEHMADIDQYHDEFMQSKFTKRP